MHTYICLYREVCLSSRGFLFGVFCLGWILSVPLLSEYTRYNRKLNITFKFRFHLYEKNLERVTSHALGPLPCHKLSHLLGPPPLERDVLYGRPLDRVSSCIRRPARSQEIMTRSTVIT